MANYTINWSSNDEPTKPDEGVVGKEPINLPEKTLNTTATSLVLTGKGVSNYGEIQQENFIRLMEHFASNVPPVNPTVGQIWYNTTECILYMHVDPNSMAQMHPRYFPASPAAWVQIWPASSVFASWMEYNALALTINKIIGMPSLSGSNVDIAENHYGWGQIDLVPEFIDAVTPVPGTYDRPFDNTVWALFLSRLRKALRHVGLAETLSSPIGFISDGRPTIGDTKTSLASSWNNYPAVGTMPDVTPGWGGHGQLSLQMFWANTVSAVTQLETNRFAIAVPSSEVQSLTSAVYTDPWGTSIQHSASLSFIDQNSAEAYFNAGGNFKFEISHVPSIINSINSSWQSFLAAQTADLKFDYKGVRQNGSYVVPPTNTQSLGFYDLTDVNQVIFSAVRNAGPYGLYTISDGGIKILARKEVIGASYVVHFTIQFIEGANAGETVQGTLTSGIVGIKANNVNVNAPILAYPTGSVSGFTAGPPPDVAPPAPGNTPLLVGYSSTENIVTGINYSNPAIGSAPIIAALTEAAAWTSPAFVIQSGSIPPGMTLTFSNSTGPKLSLFGTPSAAGSYTATIQVSQAGITNSPISVTKTISVSAPPPPPPPTQYEVRGIVPSHASGKVGLEISTSGGLINVAHLTTFVYYGSNPGQLPTINYTINSGTLPPGLSIQYNSSTSAGGYPGYSLVGVPTTAGTYNLNITTSGVSDRGLPYSYTGNVAIIINP